MWKNEEERILDIKEMAKKFKEVFEKAVIEKDTQAIDQMIYELNIIKKSLSFYKEIISSLEKNETETIEKEPQSRKDKN